ncbi:type I-E CRISPR-associated protein Cas7/Cse4/CasC [Tetragenococcus osmophilus]|uniref:Type I-E CRISPR-associated protein Cas7/Cse4/CasC n=1 Tax=Tetragenococcus osmophilus TaxID=526944 RepID=A0AA37XJV9_9ENTE|nr:type I-E CRISPR-associated protein Cas7/Cse4/CasC [Tetragenococcus osmophilus]AYW48817.1 type I-E CRISPR-associated protein Cas7/Cse4/CasC [Tetragenococcus osmophilus]GMA54817.1 type I-E CRISPR-associated protein Cas7/Cse4/CasC [Alicyclobacillus contaminans]GMA71376.1 type I-E CRISPR-associated protein Cas7/Cse4/CasC [Tetragenococcus osmophilus]
MTNQHLFLDIHAIQTLPPSNINRDDTGSPKTAQYGGVRRARVSSQSWKKAMREYFHKNSAQSNVGVRTLEIVRYIADKIKSYDSSKEDSEAMELAEKVLNEAKVKTKDQRAKALFFLGNTQAEQLAQAAVNGEKDKKQLQEILRDKPAVDIALFGRMVADDPSLNEDASSQVAHAISTHAVQTEFDFYTAVDDLAPEDNAGAGMLGTLEFNSSTLYRYANVAVHELLRQLNNKETVINTLRLFIEAFSNSIPTGKVNSYANQTLPQAIVVNLRTDRPVNLVSAFEEPVKTSNGNVSSSIKKLFNELRKVEKFVNEPEYTFYLTMEDGDNLDVDGVNEENLKTLLEHFTEVTNNLIPAEVGE